MSNFDSMGTGRLPAESLEVELRKRFAVVEHRIIIGERSYELRHPRSADELISEDDFNFDERLPYWAEIWPSAYVLAQQIASGGWGRAKGVPTSRPLRLLELGCGSGLAVMTALAAGFDVTAVDYYGEALEFVRLNALLNCLPTPNVRAVDWRDYPADLTDFDLVIAADVLYEHDYCRLVAAAFAKSLRPGGIGLLTDPQRFKAETFPLECRQRGLAISGPQVIGPLSVPGGDSAVKQTVNLFEVRHV